MKRLLNIAIGQILCAMLFDVRCNLQSQVDGPPAYICITSADKNWQLGVSTHRTWREWGYLFDVYGKVPGQMFFYTVNR